MITCVIDQIAENHQPPTREAIDQAREKQLQALRELRRLLERCHKVQVRHNAA